MQLKIKNRTLIFLFSLSTLFGQRFDISGKITDGQNGEPLIGANVVHI